MDFTEESVQKIFDGLNPKQVEAVEFLNGPLLVMAGAGSGKTRVLTCRIANLIAHGVKPYQILANLKLGIFHQEGLLHSANPPNVRILNPLSRDKHNLP